MKNIERMKKHVVMEERKPNKKLFKKNANITEKIGKPMMKTNSMYKMP
jgi:hypothetical protein